MTTTLTTERLTLRPMQMEDAAALENYCANPKVARMTSNIPHPYPVGLAANWISDCQRAQARGISYHFAIVHHAEPIGVLSLERRDCKDVEIGYWLGEPWWGKGLATEAVRRLVAFAFDRLELEELVAGHFLDNPASGRVLEKCGFRYSGEKREWSKARSNAVNCRRMRLCCDDAEREAYRR